MAATDGHAQTATYPDRPVKMLVGFAAGGGTDVAARILAQKLTEALGQTVVVENRPGASGMIAAEAVAKSAARRIHADDGQPDHARGRAGALSQVFDRRRRRISSEWRWRASRRSSWSFTLRYRCNRFSDLIALAKAKPGTINFGSGGLGTTPHMAGELFSIQAGVKMVHVAYRGEAPAINDLLGGQLHLIFANLSAVIGNVKAGSLRALAVTSAQRAATAPEIPTIAEVALPGFDAATWFALVAPAGTAREIVLRLNTEVTRLVAQPETQKRFADLGMTIGAGSPDALDAYIKSEIGKWSQVIKEADVRVSE